MVKRGLPKPKSRVRFPLVALLLTNNIHMENLAKKTLQLVEIISNILSIVVGLVTIIGTIVLLYLFLSLV